MAFLEAAGIILVVTGCFVAGVISGFMEIAEAEKANRRRIAKEQYAQNNERDLLRCCSDSVTEPATFYVDNVAYMIVPDVDYKIMVYWDRTQATENDAFADLTARASKGDRLGLACLSHSEAVTAFKEYISWLRHFFPTPDDRPSAWWSARRSICSVDFAGGGMVRFVSHISQTDGLKAWYLGDE